MSSVFRNSDYVKVYDSNRPLPTPDLLNEIQTYLSRGIPVSSWNTAIDIGCGSGLSTVGWAKEPFKRILGFDCSQAQIDLAKKMHSNLTKIEFCVSPAESLPLADSSVDLITCGQSFHYFNMPAFVQESLRVLKPGGTLGLFAYYFPTIKFLNHPTHIFPEDEELSPENLLQDFHDFYLPEQYKLLQRMELICSKYGTCRELATNFRDLELHEGEEEEGLTRVLTGTGESVVGVMRSQAMFQQYIDRDPEGALHFIQDFEEVVRRFGGKEDLARIKVELHYHYFLLLCRKPE